MAVALTRTRSDHIQLQRKFRDNDDENIHHHSNHRSSGGDQVDQKRLVVPVVYYLSRNGQLEHPHFIEVPLSSPQGLYLRDVINRLNLLRGKFMASHYSWSSKRSYKSGYVWHDLGENDFIQAVHGGEYVLKGSEIQETTSLSSPSASKSPETSSSSSGGKENSIVQSSEFPAVTRNRRRNQSWGAIDLHEYKVYKSTESTHEFAASDASTQTDDKRRRRKAVIKEQPEIIEEDERREKGEEISVISPPPSDSSPETLETLMKADKRLIATNVSASSTSSSSQAVDQPNGVDDRTVGYCPSGRMKASSVLMSLISCGSVSFKDCGANAVKDHGLSLISQYNHPSKSRMPRGGNQMMVVQSRGSDDHSGDMMNELDKNVSSSFAKMALEDKEYFSGSLVETSNKSDHQFSSLKRSSSYNADRSSHLKLEEKEVEGVRAKCIPRRPRLQSSNKKGCTAEITAVTINSTQDGSQN